MIYYHATCMLTSRTHAIVTLGCKHDILVPESTPAQGMTDMTGDTHLGIAILTLALEITQQLFPSITE